MPENNSRSKTEALLIGFLLLVTSYLMWDKFTAKPENPNAEILTYLDSMRKTTDAMFNKIDSMDKVKVELYSEITKVNLKYDTIKITVDSMLPVDATIFLLSKSRQLTAKGIE